MLCRLAAKRAVPVHQLAHSTAEQLRLHPAATESVSKLLDLASRRFFGQRCLVDVGSAIDVAVPLRSDSLCSDFHIHRGKSAEKCLRSASWRCLAAAFT